MKILMLVVALFVLTSVSLCSVSHKHQNSLGAVISDINPYVYTLGLPVDGKVFEYENRIYTSLSVRPFGTDLMYDEQILLCGNEAQSFQGMAGVLVLAYRRQATFSAGGVGCHDLLKVFQIQLPKTDEPISQDAK